MEVQNGEGHMKRKVAAIQMSARTGDVKYNIAHARELALEAAAQGAKVISLPEFFTTNIVLDDQIYDCVLPPENIALDMLREIAMDKGVLIGGSYLEKRDGDVYNCYTLVRPDGTVTRHDKDLPTMVENAYYVPGSTDGVHETPFGNVGTAVCWELIRTQTVRRLRGKIDFAMTGTHWWTAPTNWSFLKSFWEDLDKRNRVLFEGTPGRFARLLGVANIHASHCGKVVGKYAFLPGRKGDVGYETDLLGQTQIIDNEGKLIDRLDPSQGAGVIVADIELTRKEPTEELPNTFWIPELNAITKWTWWQQNTVTKGIYQRAKKDGLF